MSDRASNGLTRLGLSTSVRQALTRVGVTDIDQMNAMTDEEFLILPHFGEMRLKELRSKLAVHEAYRSLAGETAGTVDDPTPISALGLSAWPVNALQRAGLTTVGEITEWSDERLLQLPRLGAKGLRELREAIGYPVSEPAPMDLVDFDLVDDLLAAIPPPDPSIGADPQFLSLLDSALEAALPDRDRRLALQRLSVPQGGPWKTLQAVGDQFGISRERVRQIMVKCPSRLKRSVHPDVVLLRSYVERTIDELGDGDPVVGVVHYAALAFPDGQPLYAMTLVIALGVRSPRPRKKLAAEAVSLRNRFQDEAAERQRRSSEALERAASISAASQAVDQWVSSAVWPSEPDTELGRWVPEKPGRDASGNETSCEHQSVLLGRNVSCESEFERMFFSCLELSGQASWYVEQPFPIGYTDRAGKERNYWPDALVRLTDGRWLLVEVKPLFFFIGENDQRKWSAAAQRCSSRGVGFLVVDPHRKLTLGEVARHPVPATLIDEMGKFDGLPAPVPWHSARGAANRSGATFREFAAWVLQTGRAATPNPSWSIIDADDGTGALDWL